LAIRDLKVLGAEGDDLNRIQQYISNALQPILGCPLVDGNLVTGVNLKNGLTVIEHKLGRKLRGWFIVDQNAIASIYREPGTENLGSKTLTLHSSAACTVSIWCF
jgi:hypothetical protein